MWPLRPASLTQRPVSRAPHAVAGVRPASLPAAGSQPAVWVGHVGLWAPRPPALW